MSEPTPKLKLTSVDPVDELAPIPISEARRKQDPFAEPLDSIRFAEQQLEEVTLLFNKAMDLLKEDTDDGRGPDRAA